MSPFDLNKNDYIFTGRRVGDKQRPTVNFKIDF